MPALFILHLHCFNLCSCTLLHVALVEWFIVLLFISTRQIVIRLTLLLLQLWLLLPSHVLKVVLFNIFIHLLALLFKLPQFNRFPPLKLFYPLPVSLKTTLLKFTTLVIAEAHNNYQKMNPLAREESQHKDPALKSFASQENGCLSEKYEDEISRNLQDLQEFTRIDFTLHSFVYDENIMRKIKGQTPNWFNS